MASLVIRKHRLAEMFLHKVMGFGWEEVHDMAEEIEHLKCNKFFDRMDEILGFPTVDPHGSNIPDKDGNFIKPNYKLLSQIKERQKVTLKALKDSSTEFLGLLNKKEIRLGLEITVHKIETYDKSLTVSYGKFSKVILTHSVSNQLLVEAI
jgi:DtxR family Mn-dependent transcriptional regulator